MWDVRCGRDVSNSVTPKSPAQDLPGFEHSSPPPQLPPTTAAQKHEHKYSTWTWQPGGIIIPLQWSKGGNGWGVRHGPRHLHLNYPCSEQAGFLNSACTLKLRSCVCPQTQIHTHSGRWHDMSLTARSNTMGSGHKHIHKQTTNVQNGVHR